MSMFGIGMTELLVILVVALVVLGPSRLPEVARSLGRALGELRRQSSEVLEEFQAQGRTDEPPKRTPVTARRPADPGVPTTPTPAAAPPVEPAAAVPDAPASDRPRTDPAGTDRA